MKNNLTYDQVLLIDDDRIVNLVNEHIIKNCGISKEIKAFLNPLDALIELQNLLLQTNAKILVLLDLNMPEMTGFEILDKVARLNNNSMVFDLIIVSSSIDNNDISKGRKNPLVQGYITKPLTYEKLSNFVENHSQIAVLT